jgi:hypothetical protein
MDESAGQGDVAQWLEHLPCTSEFLLATKPVTSRFGLFPLGNRGFFLQFPRPPACTGVSSRPQSQKKTSPFGPNEGHLSRGVLEFECGVLVYEPADARGYWRVRWVEDGRRRDTSARSRDLAISKATEFVERLSIGVPTTLAAARGRVLVEHFLDPGRLPARGRGWSERHREEQEPYCQRFVLPVIAEVLLRSLSWVHLQRVLDQAATPAMAGHLRNL